MADWSESPTAVLPYAFDWTEDLGSGETILSSSFAITGPDTNLTILGGSESIAAPFTRLWMTGGTLGVVYQITNRITGSLDPGDIDERTSALLIKIESALDPLRFKDPDAVLPFVVSWPRWIDPNEAIVSSTWSLTGPDSSLAIVPSSQSIHGTTTALWLQGGTVGARYRITNHIVTSSSPIARQDDRWFDVLVKQR